MLTEVMLEELGLILFTVLSQFAVGVFSLLHVTRHVLNKSEAKSADKATDNGFIITLAVMVIGMLCALFHMGNLSHVIFTIFNFRTSWLAREIIIAAVFVFLNAVIVFCYKKDETAFGNGVGWINIVVGAVLVFAEASIYSTSIVPAWSNVNTYITFYCSALLLGVTGTVWILALAARKGSGRIGNTGLLKKHCWLSVIAVAVPLVCLPVYLSSLNGLGDAAAESAALLTGPYMGAHIVRWVASLLAVALVFLLLYKKSDQPGSFAEKAPIFLIICILAFVGEGMGRVLFYAIGIPLGIPYWY